MRYNLWRLCEFVCKCGFVPAGFAAIWIGCGLVLPVEQPWPLASYIAGMAGAAFVAYCCLWMASEADDRAEEIAWEEGRWL